MEGTGAADDTGDRDLAAEVMQLAPILPEISGALLALAAWAQAERGARTLGGVLMLADGMAFPPPEPGPGH